MDILHIYTILVTSVAIATSLVNLEEHVSFLCWNRVAHVFSWGLLDGTIKTGNNYIHSGPDEADSSQLYSGEVMLLQYKPSFCILIGLYYSKTHYTSIDLIFNQILNDVNLEEAFGG